MPVHLQRGAGLAGGRWHWQRPEGNWAVPWQHAARGQLARRGLSSGAKWVWGEFQCQPLAALLAAAGTDPLVDTWRASASPCGQSRPGWISGPTRPEVVCSLASKRVCGGEGALLLVWSPTCLTWSLFVLLSCCSSCWVAANSVRKLTWHCWSRSGSRGPTSAELAYHSSGGWPGS